MDFIAIIERTKRILVNPAEEWKIIREEPKTKMYVVRTFALPYILMLAIATFLGMVLFRSYIPPGIMIVISLVTFFGAFLSLFVSAWLINAFAGLFDSKRDINSAFSLVVYSYTALFITHAVGNLILPLFFITLLGIYCVYVLWIGLGDMMETPGEKQVGFGLVSSVTILVVYVTMNTLLGMISTSLLVSSGINSLT